MNEDKKIIVISLGGSLIVPEEIDTGFLKEFKELILNEVGQGRKFVIITGGGKINKKYNAATKVLSEPTYEDLDWIGIASLKLNAELIRVIFSDYANKKVVDNLSHSFSFEKSIVVGSAYEPGKSSDWDSVEAAKTVGAQKIVNLSNTDYVYDSDPKENSNAKKIKSISWTEYRKIIPSEWTSRLHTPFDPVASKSAEEAGIEVTIMNGKPLDNLKNYLAGEKFEGTVIS